MSTTPIDGASVYAPAAFRRALLGFLVADLALLGAWTAMTVRLLDGFGASLVPIALGAPLAVAVWVHAPVRRAVLGALRLDATAVLCAALVFAVATFAVIATRVPDALLSSAPSATAIARSGAVDVVVAASDDTARSSVAAALPAIGSEPTGQEEAAPIALLLDGVLEARRAEAELRLLGSPVRAAVLELDLAEAARFGGDPAASGLGADVTLPSDGMLLGADVARAIGARVGDRVMVDFGVMASSLLVSGVLPAHGFGTLDPTPGVSQDAPPVIGPVLVAPGTLANGGATGTPLLLLSATGDGASGKAIAGTLAEAVGRVPTAGSAGVAVVQPAAFVESQMRSSLTAARDDLARAGLVTSVTALVGCLIAAAGLAHRRRTSVLVLRDLGMARTDVVSALAVECWLAALVGVSAGTGIGAALAHRTVDAAIAASGAVTSDVQRDVVRWAAMVFFVAAVAGTVALVRSTAWSSSPAPEGSDRDTVRRRGVVAIVTTWTARNARVLAVVLVVGVPLATARARLLHLAAPVSVLRDLAVPFAIAGVLALGAVLALWTPLRATTRALRVTGGRARPFASALSFAVGATVVVASLLGSRAAVLLSHLVRQRGS